MTSAVPSYLCFDMKTVNHVSGGKWQTYNCFYDSGIPITISSNEQYQVV